jgi:hypothetical protein
LLAIAIGVEHHVVLIAIGAFLLTRQRDYVFTPDATDGGGERGGNIGGNGGHEGGGYFIIGIT